MNKSDSTVIDDRTYPESVYRWITDEPEELADGTFAPPFTRVIAEKIAATKPAWASFDHTDFNGDLSTADPELYYMTWCSDYDGRVQITQNAFYNFDGEKVREEQPAVQVWCVEGGMMRDRDELYKLALDIIKYTTMYEEIVNPTPLELEREEMLGYNPDGEMNHYRSITVPSAITQHGSASVSVYDEGEPGSEKGPLVYLGDPKEDITIEEAEQYLCHVGDMIALAHRVRLMEQGK